MTKHLRLTVTSLFRDIYTYNQALNNSFSKPSFFPYFLIKLLFYTVNKGLVKLLFTGVFGRPDPLVQELITAVVVKKSGSSLTEQQLIQFAHERLDEYKQIRGGLKFVDSIPRNPQGKIVKLQLSNLFTE